MKSLLRTTGEILKFEVVCKLLTICLVYPVLGGVYRIYAASEGLNFNSGAAFAFVSPAGVVVLLLVAAAAFYGHPHCGPYPPGPGFHLAGVVVGLPVESGCAEG